MISHDPRQRSREGMLATREHLLVVPSRPMKLSVGAGWCIRSSARIARRSRVVDLDARDAGRIYAACRGGLRPAAFSG
jgi:hypothetical protein